MALPSIVVASVTNAESSVVIPQHARQVLMQCRTAVDVRFAFAASQVASGDYCTCKSGSGFNLVLAVNPGGLLPDTAKLYLYAASSVSVEIIFAS